MKYCIDIDDTILFSKINDDGEYELVGENYKLIGRMRVLYNRGHEIILWTGRHWNHMEVTIKHLEKYRVPYHTLIMGKPPVDYYVDDKAIRPDEFLELEV